MVGMDAAEIEAQVVGETKEVVKLSVEEKYITKKILMALACLLINLDGTSPLIEFKIIRQHVISPLN